MTGLWVGIVLLSLSWLFLLPLAEPAHWAGWVMVAAGVAATTFSFRSVELQPLPRAYAVFVAPLAVFALVVGWPQNLGALFLIAALAGALLMARSARAWPVICGMAAGGAVLFLQALVSPVYQHVAARLHGFPLLDPVFAFVINLLGGGASYTSGALFIKTGDGVGELYTTWESLGFYILVNVAAGGLGALFFTGRLWERLLRLFILLSVYALARYVLLLFAFASFGTADIFWHRPWVIASFLPLTILLMKWLPLSPLPRPLALAEIGWKPRAVAPAALATVAIFAAVGGLLFQDPGVKKQGRILFDEGHSNWEWMERPYDTEWYGEQSGYNYYSLGQYLNHYYRVDVGKQPLTADLLSNYDVAVLKTPTTPYSPDEIRAVVDFVKRGGGLWLIGDHTNVFGMGTYLNEVSGHFGFAFKFDATYDLATGNLSYYEPPKMARHPVINHLPFYLFATSCSLDAPMLSENVIVGYGLKAASADYSQRSFFPKDAHSVTAIEHGLLLQAAAARYGDGRVLLYTDSTCFSNFFMFMPGKPELVLGSIDWLNRKNRFGFVRLLLAALAAASLGAAVFLARGRRRDEVALMAVFALALGVGVGAALAGAVNQRTYPRSQPHTAYPIVAFEGEHSNYYLPATSFKSGDQGDMQTFYVWTQRLGLYPEVRYKFLDCLNNSRAIVIMNPERDFSRQEVAEFEKYVEGGGSVLLMDDPRNRLTSTAHQLLQPFNARVEYQEIAEGDIEDAQGELIWRGQHLGQVSGGQPILFAKATPQPRPDEPPAGATAQAAQAQLPAPAGAKPGQAASKTGPAKGGPAKGGPAKGQVAPVPEFRAPVLSLIRKGQGTLAVLAGSTLFTAQAMGGTATVPDASRRKVYDLEYRIFRDLLNVAAGAEAKTVSRR